MSRSQDGSRPDEQVRSSESRLRRPRRRWTGRVETLEPRVVLNAAFDGIGLTAARNDPTFGASLDGMGPDGRPIGIAVIDTGTNGSNPALVESLAAAYDAVLGSPREPSESLDGNGRGSQAGSLIVSDDPTIGVTSMGRIVAVRAVARDGEPQAPFDAVANALQWVIDNARLHNIKVVDLSAVDDQMLNSSDEIRPGGSRLAALDQLIGQLEAQGITVVAAAGDRQPGMTGEGVSTAATVATLGVSAATTPGGPNSSAREELSPLSRRGTAANLISAPGDAMRAVNAKNALTSFRSGSAMASAVVGGVVALLQDAAATFGERSLLPSEIRDILKSTSDVIPDSASAISTAEVDDSGPSAASLSLETGMPATLAEASASLTAMLERMRSEAIAAEPRVSEAIETLLSTLNGHNRTSPSVQAASQTGWRTDNRVQATSDDANSMKVESNETAGGLIQVAQVGENGSLDRIRVDRAVVETINRVRTTVEGELNATLATAVELGVVTTERAAFAAGFIGSDGQNAVGANDVDLYRVETDGQGRLRARVIPTGDNGAGLNAELRIFDAQGQQVARAQAPLGQAVTIATPDQASAARRVFFVGVSALGNAAYDPTTGTGATSGSTTGGYDLEVLLEAPDPNGTAAGAQRLLNLPVVDFTATIGNDPAPIGSVGVVAVGGNDVDMYLARANDDGLFRVQVLGTGTPALTGFLAIYEIDAQTGVRRFLSSSTNPSGTLDNELTVPAIRGNDYLVVIADATNTTFDLDNGYNRRPVGTGGGYRMSAAFDNRDVDGAIPLIGPEAIRTLPVNAQFQRVEGTIGIDPGVDPVGRDGRLDVDTWAFRAESNAVFEMRLAPDASGADPAVSVELWSFDPQTNRAARLASSRETGSTNLAVPVPAGQVVYVTLAADSNARPLWAATTTGIPRAEPFTPIPYAVEARMRPASDLNGLLDDSIRDATGITNLSDGVGVVARLGDDQTRPDGPILARGAADLDLYRIRPTRSGSVTLTTFRLDSTSPDTKLRLFDAQGNEIAANDDFVADAVDNQPVVATLNAGGYSQALVDARLTANLDANVTYFVGVTAVGEGTNDYNALTGQGVAPAAQGLYGLRLEGGGGVPPTPGGRLEDFIVQFGERQRSFVNHVRMVFSDDTNVDALFRSVTTNRPDRIRMFRSNLHGTGLIPVEIADAARREGQDIVLDFGPQGIGGPRATPVPGDAIYTVLIDANLDGRFETRRRFFRLLGDVDGNRIVDRDDVQTVQRAVGVTTPERTELDVNGDGRVDQRDVRLTQRSVGRRVIPPIRASVVESQADDLGSGDFQ